MTFLAYLTYIFCYDIIIFYFWNKRGNDFFSILTGSVFVYACGIFDIVDSMFFHHSYTLFIYSVFVFHVGMVFIQLQRYNGMYRGLEQSNAVLETTIQERNRLLGQIETMLNQTAVVPKSLAKGSLSFDIIAGRAFIESGGKTIDLLLKQKEFAVLFLLAQNEGKTMNAQTIYENVWKLPLRDDNTLKATISTMRKKIELSGYTVSVIRGEGYVFERI